MAENVSRSPADLGKCSEITRSASQGNQETEYNDLIHNDYIDDILSPEYENQPRPFISPPEGSDQASLHSLSLIPSSQSLDNIALDTTGMEESIDLSTAAELIAISSATPNSSVKKCFTIKYDERNFNKENKLADEVDENAVQNVSPGNLVYNAEMVSDEWKKIICSNNSSSVEQMGIDSIANVENITGASNAKIDCTHIFDCDDKRDVMLVCQSDRDGESEITLQNPNFLPFPDKSNSFHLSRKVCATEDSVNFFVEESESSRSGVDSHGLHETASTRSLTKFFATDVAGGTDIEGKHFFDSFSTGNEETKLIQNTCGPIFTQTFTPSDSHNIELTDIIKSTGDISDPSSSAAFMTEVDQGRSVGLVLQATTSDREYNFIPCDDLCNKFMTNCSTDAVPEPNLNIVVSISESAANGSYQHSEFPISNVNSYEVAVSSGVLVTKTIAAASGHGISSSSIEVTCESSDRKCLLSPSCSVEGILEDSPHYDAWLPSENTAKLLQQIQSESMSGKNILSSHLSRPGIIYAESLVSYILLSQIVKYQFCTIYNF